MLAADTEENSKYIANSSSISPSQIMMAALVIAARSSSRRQLLGRKSSVVLRSLSSSNMSSTPFSHKRMMYTGGTNDKLHSRGDHFVTEIRERTKPSSKKVRGKCELKIALTDLKKDKGAVKSYKGTLAYKLAIGRVNSGVISPKEGSVAINIFKILNKPNDCLRV